MTNENVEVEIMEEETIDTYIKEAQKNYTEAFQNIQTISSDITVWSTIVKSYMADGIEDVEKIGDIINTFIAVKNDEKVDNIVPHDELVQGTLKFSESALRSFTKVRNMIALKSTTE